MNFIKRLIRFLIRKDILGTRLINLFNQGIFYDHVGGLIYQLVDDHKIILHKIHHGLSNENGIDMVKWLNQEVYFKEYLPSGNDIYVDIGCGYGHELVYATSRSSNIEVYGIEANPLIFQYCRANCQLKNIYLSNYMVSDENEYLLPLDNDYAGHGQNDSGALSVNGISLTNFLDKNNIARVDFLKLNIEGGELEITKNLPHERVKRVLISCHDFRYLRGDGAFFKTYDEVLKLLNSYGYKIRNIEPNIIPSDAWSKSLPYWIYGEK